jgi:Cof subfamily protein (haloacid dehalogenase superfamily)
MIKLISLDVDGTLLDRKGKLSQTNLEAIQAAKKRGVHIVINTGKPLSAVINLINDLGVSDPVITLTGGLILGKNANGVWQELYNFPVPTPSLQPIFQTIKNIPLSTFFFSKSQCYVHHIKQEASYLQKFQDTLKRNTVNEYKLISKSPLLDYEDLEIPPYKIMFYSDIRREIEMTYSALDKLRYPGLMVEGGSADTVDVHLAQSGKRQGVELICKKLNIQRHEVMALGDHESDFELIQWAGVGAIMANARIYLKAMAPLIAPSNESNGVATMIHSYAL